MSRTFLPPILTAFVAEEKSAFVFQQFHLIPYLTAIEKRDAGAIFSQHDRRAGKLSKRWRRVGA